MVAIPQAANDLGRCLLAREVEEILLDVLDLERALLQAVLLYQVFHGSVLYRAAGLETGPARADWYRQDNKLAWREHMPLAPVLSEGLSRYAIGDTIRALRRQKKMGLVELGQHSGLSPALLSKLERGKLFPTLPTLLRIALVFSVGLEYFFSSAHERRSFGIVRRGERRRFPEGAEVKEPAYLFESLDFASVERRTNAYYAEFQPSRAPKVRTHTHAGGEFIFVLDGALELTLGSETCLLEREDSVYFDASRPHGYRRQSPGPCRAVVVTSPA